MRGIDRRGAGIASALVLMVGALHGAGCQTMGPIAARGPSAVSAAGSGYSYQAGTAAQSFSRPRIEVETASQEALADLQMRLSGNVDWGPERTAIHARSADGRRVELTIVDRGSSTEALVKVGLFGDEAMSKALLDRIGMRLGEQPPEAIPDEVPSTPESNPYFSRDAVPDEVMLEGFTDSGHQTPAIP